MPIPHTLTVGALRGLDAALGYRPTATQVAAILDAGDRHPVAYRLEAQRNWFPARLADHAGQAGVCVEICDRRGAVCDEQVVLADGQRFSLLERP